MRFLILGPLEVWDGDSRLSVGGPQQRALLAILLLSANRVVSADRLIVDLWSGQPPPAARRLLQGCVVRLRRALRGRQALVTRPPGYLLEVRPGELDLDRFEELVTVANQSEPEEAAVLLTDALALWRGPALDGMSTDICQMQARRLDERRQTALEARIDADLQVGRYSDLVGELQAHVRAHPLRERLWAQLMLALDGAGRRADALAAYRELRQTLVDELGVEPNSALMELERVILRGGDALEFHRASPGATAPNRPPGGAVPSQLPAAVAAFTGREAQLKELDGRLTDSWSTAVVITAIDGTAGVGKTALAVHWAHRVRERFPDGQLYVSLRGYARTPPMRTIDALVGFLYALGVPADQIPVDVEQAAALYRTLVADKRMLVVLDNARSPDQVRPLLPGGRDCLALITSRDQLNGLVALDGARRISLDVLAADEAEVLLARIIGEDRVAAERDATDELAQACALLPLALRIAAANLTSQPGRGIAGFAAALTEGNRLAHLRVDGDEHTAVRAAFDLSYAALTPGAQRMFRLLGLVPGPDVTCTAAAALAGTTPARAGQLLDRLARAHMLAQHVPGRYSFHDLLRAYAADHAHDHEKEPDRRAAIERLYDWYVHTARSASKRLAPQLVCLPLPPAAIPPLDFEDHRQALTWLDDERVNLLAAVVEAAHAGPRPAAYWLTDTLRAYLRARMHTTDWLAAAEAALTAAGAEGDLQAQAAVRLSLGDIHQHLSQYPLATDHYTAGLDLAQRAGWLEGHAAILRALGNVYWPLGRLRDAAEHYTRALVLNRQGGQLAGQAQSLGSLGLAYRSLGRLLDAADSLEQALVLFRQIRSRSAEAACLGNLGEVQHNLGRLDRAVEHLSDSLRLYRETGDRAGEADVLRVLAAVHRDTGNRRPAFELARTALHLARDTGDRRVEANALNTLSTVHEQFGRHGEAIDGYQHALELARESGNAYPETEALIGLASAHLGRGELDQAGAGAKQALTITREIGYRMLEGQALTALAAVELDASRSEAVVEHAHQALDIHRDTGHRLGQARTLLVLGHALRCTGGAEAAVSPWREALVLFTEMGTPEAGRVEVLLRQR